MKREIKFRIWDNTLKQMEEPFTLNDDFDCVQGWLDGCELMQFTGLKDRNGREIYEGDITDEGIVIFHEEYLGFFTEDKDRLEQFVPLYDIPFYEVIGNIHENPELL